MVGFIKVYEPVIIGTVQHLLYLLFTQSFIVKRNNHLNTEFTYVVMVLRDVMVLRGVTIATGRVAIRAIFVTIIIGEKFEETLGLMDVNYIFNYFDSGMSVSFT